MDSKRPGSKGIPQKRRRVGRWFHLGSRSTRDRPDTTIPTNDQGRQGSDRLRRPLAFRHLGTHRPRRQALARCLRARLSCGDAASGFGGRDHTILAPLRGDDPWFLHPGDRSPGTSSPDPRDGGPSADLHHGGFEAPPVRDPPSFHRVCGESVVARGQDGSGIARDDQLRRMDRRAPLCAAQGVRPERRGILVRRRRVGGSEGSVEHADRQGDGRLFGRLRHERRALAAAARVSAATDGPRLRGNL